MKKITSFWFSPMFCYLGLSALLLVALSACSVSGTTPEVPALPTADSHNTQISPLSNNLKGLQQNQTTMFTLPNRTSIKNLVSIQSNIWFSEYDNNRVGKLNAQGQFDEYALPSTNARPSWGTLGLDGNFWFSEEGADRIAEISSQGNITEYTIPTVNAAPGQMLLWGNMLWFTETKAHKLSRLNQDRQMIEFSLSGAPDQIVVAGSEDTNGQIWFTEPATRKIGCITFDGQIKEFSLPASITKVDSIIGEAVGNLWFTTGQSITEQLGYVTQNGHFTLFSTGKQNVVDQLMHDGDGIDFIEHNSNTIWTINTQGTIQARFTVFTNFALPTPLTRDTTNGSYWYAKTGTQQSQIWNLNISPYGP